VKVKCWNYTWRQLTFGTGKVEKKIEIKNLDCSLCLTSLSVGLRGAWVEAKLKPNKTKQIITV